MRGIGAQPLAAKAGLVTDPFALGPLQPIVLGGVMILGTLAGLLPALTAYRMEVAESLAPLS